MKNYETQQEWLDRMEDKATSVVCYTMAGLCAFAAIVHLFGGRLIEAAVFALLATVMFAIARITRKEGQRNG